MGNAAFRVMDPEKIEFEMTVSMSLGNWKLIRKELSESWPSAELGCLIQDMLWQAEKKFYPKNTEET